MSKALLIALAMDKLSYPAKGRFNLKGMQRRPLLGLAYICSAIESGGLESELLDQSVSDFSIEDLINHIKNNEYIFIGFYSQVLIKDKLIAYIKAIKEKTTGIKIIVGGPAYMFYEEFLKGGCDIVCKGEGELTILEIVEYLEGRRAIESIDGIAYMKNGSVISNRDRELITNLDSIPFPLWDKIKPRCYYDSYILPMKGTFVPMVTSRGCVYRCAFCSSPYLWRNNYRVRSIENVLKETDILVSRYRARYIIFQDDAFGTDNNWLRKFCLALIERRYKKLRWMCILHPLVFKEDPEQLIFLIKRAGCNLFVFGLQSVSPDVSRKINRDPLEPEVLRKIIKITNNAGILTSVDFILGLPGETEKTIRENIDFALEARPHLVNFHPLRLEPGSELATDYQNGKVCDFSQEELLKFCHRANWEFYLNIANLTRVLRFICKENPFLFFKISRFYTLLKHYT